MEQSEKSTGNVKLASYLNYFCVTRKKIKNLKEVKLSAYVDEVYISSAPSAGEFNLTATQLLKLPL